MMHDNVGHWNGRRGRGGQYVTERPNQTTWLERAETLVDRSHAWVDAELRAGDRPLSLFWGALGPLLAELELERPELAAMPLFASEGWPA